MNQYLAESNKVVMMFTRYLGSPRLQETCMEPSKAKQLNGGLWNFCQGIRPNFAISISLPTPIIATEMEG